ncbi:MAG TPA: hypothetical protein VE889_05265, partial [Actinomycetota bacterium]|nr:hypothetical protein [Actinomycetota bacterium]
AAAGVESSTPTAIIAAIALRFIRLSDLLPDGLALLVWESHAVDGATDQGCVAGAEAWVGAALASLVLLRGSSRKRPCSTSDGPGAQHQHHSEHTFDSQGHRSIARGEK